MLRDRLVKVLLSEILSDLGAEAPAALGAGTMEVVPVTAPKNQKTPPMISTGSNAPLFFSPNEEKIVALLREQGPMKQAAIIERLEMDMNATRVKELLANLRDRKVIFNGPDGYELFG